MLSASPLAVQQRTPPGRGSLESSTSGERYLPKSQRNEAPITHRCKYSCTTLDRIDPTVSDAGMSRAHDASNALLTGLCNQAAVPQLYCQAALQSYPRRTLCLFASEFSASRLGAVRNTVTKPGNPDRSTARTRKSPLCQRRRRRYPYSSTNHSYRWWWTRTHWTLRHGELSHPNVAPAVAV